MVKAVVFSDFDGTITLEDSNDYVSDKYGMGKEKRLKLFEKILNGNESFSVGFRTMLEGIKLPFNECVDICVGRINLDPGFKKTYDYCQEHGIPLIIVSSGMKPIIRALMGKYIGEEAASKLEIMSNDVKIDPVDKNKWDIVYKDTTPHGHDKSLSITEKKEFFEKNGDKPTYFYCGDGISDLSAAKECDLLFAKKGKDLITFCERDHIPYHDFENWDDIYSSITKVMEGKATVDELMQNH